MKAVVNATPLINFASINRLDILESLFGEIMVPFHVWDEVVTKADKYETSQIIQSAKFIKLGKANDELLYPFQIPLLQ